MDTRELPPENPWPAEEAPGRAPLTQADVDALFAEPSKPRLRVALGGAFVLALVAAAIFVGLTALSPHPSTAIPTLSFSTTAPPSLEAASGGPLVHVTGSVHKPGVYELHAGDRIIDAIAAAGGATEEADPEALNLARPVTDGEQIRVPKIGDIVETQAATGGTPGGGSGLINLNTADVAALETLPRIGPALAQRILDYRSANGPFTSVDELGNVAGIGSATLEALRALVTV